MNTFETVRGVRFLEIVPDRMDEIAKELKKNNEILSKRNSILEEQNSLLKELYRMKTEIPEAPKALKAAE